MAEVTLIAEPGRRTGTPASKRLRAAGRIPAVVYGHGGDPAAVSVDARELRVALSGDAGTNQLLDLRVGADRHLTMARVIQRHPVRNTVVHVDFQVVRRDEMLSVEVPLVLDGEARVVEMDKGVVEQVLTSLTVKALPGNIPNELTIDVSGLQIGDTIRVGDIRLPAEVTTDVDPEEAVVLAAASRVAAEVEEIEEEAAAAGPAAASDGGAAVPADGAADGAASGDGAAGAGA